VSTKKVVRMLSTPITLIILLGLLASGVWWGYKTVTARVVGPPPPSCVVMPMTELTTSSVTVNVYNSGDQRGLAGRVADALRTGGFMVGTVDNADNKVLTILIVGAAADNPEVQLVAGWFVDPEIQADDRPDHTVDIYVGNGYNETTSMVPEAPTSLQVPSGEVCLPATATPTDQAGEEPPTQGPPAPEEPAAEEPAEEPAPEDEPT